MAKKENTGKAPKVEKLKLCNMMTMEVVTIADDELANYDARLWKTVNNEVKDPAIRLEDIEAKRQEKKPEQRKSKAGKNK